MEYYRPLVWQRSLKLIGAILIFAFCTASLHRSVAQSLNIFSGEEIPSVGGDHITLSSDPYVNRWRRKFSSKSGYIFHKHIRKAGGTAIRNYITAALEHHGFGTFQQFLNNTDEQEALRHFPFLEDEQKEEAKRYYNQTRTMSAVHSNKPKVYYIEQEFSSQDWDCRDVDPRWNNSLSIIVLRHPIERHLSEFFYSGLVGTEFAGMKIDTVNSGRLAVGHKVGIGKKTIPRKGHALQIDRTRLYTNKTYTQALSAFLQENLQRWGKTQSTNQQLKWYFGHKYTDNFQLRALAGCASGSCMYGKNVSSEQMDQIGKSRPAINATTPSVIDSVCTMHPFYKSRDACNTKRPVCKALCDGPCFYPAAAWGALDEKDLSHAIHALEGYDLVLLTEAFDNKDQRALMADSMSVPRHLVSDYIADKMKMDTALFKMKKLNINTEKKNSREKTHYYRDLMGNLTPPILLDSMILENKLDIQLYEHAIRLNTLITERWKQEVKWSG